MTETQKEILNFFYDAMCTLFCGWQRLIFCCLMIIFMKQHFLMKD